MVPPRRFSNISDSGDISHTGYSKRQRMDKTPKNAHFDQMIQSMSAAVNRDRRQPKASYDAYSPSRSTTVTSELSFVKRTDTRRSSSASKASSETSSSDTCNPLPRWLVNTFMTLSKKNPLRLMLPSDISEGTDSGLHPQTVTTAQSIDVSATGPSFVFDLPDPSGIQAQKSDHNLLVSDDDQENWLEPLPFSTPGPGSFLGSSVASNNTDLSLHIPPKTLSTDIYSTLGLHYCAPRPVRFDSPLEDATSSDHLQPGYEIDYADLLYPAPRPVHFDSPLKDASSSDHLQPGYEIDYADLHCSAPQAVHFDSPLEDALSSDHLQPGYEIDYDTIDFHWKPFDRKNLVVSDRLQKPIYASRPVHSNGASYTSECERAVNTETNTLNSYIAPEPASPLLSISPAPFRFLVPPEKDTSVSVLKSQNQNAIQKPSTPKRSPYFQVPGIYISPLDEHRRIHETNYPARRHDEYAGDSVEQANSQASNDSIESWEENLG